MQIELRADDPGLGDGDILVHMGAGDAGLVALSAARNREAYSVLVGPPGIFAVSVYAAVRGITVERVLAGMPHRQYGSATYGQIRTAGFELIPTYVYGTAIEDDLMGVHYDIAIPVPQTIAANDLHDADERSQRQIEQALADPLGRLLKLFEPRQRK